MGIESFGIHSVFYYYGLQHLNVNMYKYINDEIQNNSVIYICADEHINFQLKNIITNEKEHIKSFPLDDFVKVYNDSSTTKVKEFIFNWSENVKRKGYDRVKIISQPSYIISQLSQDKFLQIEKQVDEFIEDLDVSILCIYDFEDYLKEKKFITEDVMRESYTTHKYRLYNMNLIDIEACFK